jgi:hypothetical protein
MSNDSLAESPLDDDELWATSTSELTGGSLDYLDDVLRDAFKREEDNNEAIWRSLPFFAAILGITLTFAAKAAEDRPAWSDSSLAWLANLIFWLAIILLFWALRWFYELLRPRPYRYPPESKVIWQYAEDVRNFHLVSGKTGKALERDAGGELKAFMARQYGLAASTNLSNNQARFEARSQTILFLMLAFLLVIVSQGIKYGHELSQSSAQEVQHGSRLRVSSYAAGSEKPRGAAEAASRAHSAGGSAADKAFDQSRQGAQRKVNKDKPPVPANNAQRPKPPVGQVVMKEHRDTASVKPKPVTVEKK